MANKILPSRRDKREALGYLADLFDAGVAGDESHIAIAERLVENAVRVRVLRHNDVLRLEFDLADDDVAADDVVDAEIVGDGTGEALPEATGEPKLSLAKSRPVADSPQA